MRELAVSTGVLRMNTDRLLVCVLGILHSIQLNEG